MAHCTGVFPNVTTKKALLIEPDQVVSPVIAAIVRNRKLGILAPLPEQRTLLLDKWAEYDLSPVISFASPFAASTDHFEAATDELVAQRADIILLYCMAYVEEQRTIVEKRSKLPVILSSAVVAGITAGLL